MQIISNLSAPTSPPFGLVRHYIVSGHYRVNAAHKLSISGDKATQQVLVLAQSRQLSMVLVALISVFLASVLLSPSLNFVFSSSSNLS